MTEKQKELANIFAKEFSAGPMTKDHMSLLMLRVSKSVNDPISEGMDPSRLLPTVEIAQDDDGVTKRVRKYL
jgi:hypothetical protein